MVEGDVLWRLNRLEHIIDGNGKPGLIRELSDHRADFSTHCKLWEQREKDKMIYDNRQARRIKVLLLIMGTIIVPLMIALFFKGH